MAAKPRSTGSSTNNTDRDKPTLASTASRASGPRLKCIVYPGNNPTAVVRALQCRASVWDDPAQDTGAASLATNDRWAENFVWKPTWSRLKPCPPEYRRWAKDVKARQIVNHLVAVEPLCTKDSLCAVMSRFYKSIRVDPFEYMPFTVLVTLNGGDPSKWPGWSTFVAAFRFCASIKGCRNLWLLKPTRWAHCPPRCCRCCCCCRWRDYG